MLRTTSSLLVCLLLAALVVSVRAEAKCSAYRMTGFNADDFYTVPQNTTTLSVCTASSGNACCNPSYDQTIGIFEDPLSVSFKTIISEPRDQCRALLNDVSCLLCSPEQTSSIVIQQSSTKLLMCSTFCSTLYDACKDDYTTMEYGYAAVSEIYEEPLDFCAALFDQISSSEYAFNATFLDEGPIPCWNDLPECTEDDYYALFTPCENNQRTRIFVKKPEVQCEGGVPLPPPATVACARSCRPGQRMGPLGCQNCPRGYYSLGGAAVVTHWDSWTQVRKTIPFRTYCTRTDAYGVERVVTDVDCSWELEGFQVSSPSLNNSMSAYLETSIILLEDGVFQFIAEVDAEPHYDGLNVLVDRNSLTGLLYENRTFSTFQYDLTAGYHFIQFVYSKDVSRAVGSDAAVINRVAITNVNYASDTCDPCEPGTYAPNTASTHCLDCPLNTKQPEAHAHDCISCDPDTEYSPPGSTECLPRPACTESSVYYLYGPCQIEQTSGQPKRELRAYWVEPHICLSNELPATTWEECALCEAGQVRDSNGITCSFCPTGTYSAGNGQAQCEPCLEGTEAIPALVFDTFNDFSNGLSTKCELNCGSAGWVLHQDYITSGDAHGKSVISTLMLNQTLESDGILTFSFSLICAQGCTLAFSSDAGVGYRAYGGTLAMFGQNPTNVEMSYPITAGDHSFIWQFIKNDQEELSPTDHAVIFEIKLTHASVGGATECSPCKPGFYSNDIEVAKCKPAPAGYYVPEHGATAPTMCEGNTITTHEGSVACSACGENVDSNAEHTECDVTCLFTDDVRGYRTEYYDLNGMARTDGEMYGPIYDQQNHTYYLNMCNEQHNQHVCFDEHQNPIETYVCQVTVVGLGEDLGDTFGIIPLRSAFTPDTLGVTVHLTGGDQCHNGTNYFDRQTYIDVLCDPTAGVGTPLPTSYDNVEVWKCVYAFKWLSLYGCPVCSENDYYTYTTECDPDTQEQTKIYAWTDNPKRCHDGIELPAPETIPCSVSSIYCGPGEYLNVTSNECVLAPAGFYSIGNGIVIDNWETLQRGFSSSDWSPIAAGQDPNYSQIQSGVDDTQLVYVHDFVTDGYVSFTCYVNTYGDSTAAFSVYVDNVLVQRVTETGYYMLDFPVPAGYHYFVFLFEGGSTLTTEYAPRLVSIHQMKILGIVYAAENPVPCPPGFAASVTADYYDDGTGVDPTVIYEGATSCVICPGNYYAHQGQVSCTPCREDEYSLRGSRSCSPKVVCSEKSYQVVYSECDASTLKQTRSYQLIQPSVCIVDGGSWVPPADEVIDCAICELGHYRDGSECSVCPAGRFWDESEQRCRKSESGNAAILTSGFFTQPSPGVELPEGFLTGCEGNCACFDCRNGWIFLGDHVSSGRNPGREIDTWLVLDLTLINPGKISFVYTVDGSVQNGLQFYIDNKIALVPYHPLRTAKETVSDEYLDFGNGTVQVSFDLDNGFHSFRWVYHQTINTDGVVTLRDIVFEGVGGATVDTQCPAGQYSPGPEASYCVDCPKGTASSQPGSTGCAVCDKDTYADTEGADHCSQCGENLSANEDGTDCETDCVFHFDDQDYDISPLNDYHGPFAMTSSNTKSIWINLCSKRSSSVICIDPAGDPINTYICQLDAHGNGVDMGHYLSVTQGARGAKAANATAETDDTPAIPHKDPAPIIFSYTEAASKRCKTTITLVCDVDNTNSSPRETTSSTSCNLQLEWPTAFACPLCDDSDYAEQESECVDGVQTVTSVRKGKCYGPAVKGDSREESCPTRYSFPLVVIISVLIVLVILAVAIIVVVMYSFKIRNQYVALVRDSEGQYEMKNIEDNDLTEDKKDVV